MNYIQIFIPTRDSLQSEIYMADLAELPFESFEQEEVCLKAYIRKDDFESVRTQVEEYLHSTGVECRITEIEAENWNSVWEAGFTPVVVEDRCTIRAPFHEPNPSTTLDIVIMPKMSFGTGHHATTYLMALEITDKDFSEMRGLDMGSGTGVLAIIAAKRGAERIDAVDIDEWAFENCAENTNDNGVADKVNPILGDVEAIKGRKYDFILANINRNILLADMEQYVEAMNCGAILIMSGILERDIAAISAKAESLGLRVTGTRTKDGWALVSCKK